MSMLRPIFSVSKSSATGATSATKSLRFRLPGLTSRTFATQSGDDAQPPTALAKLHLEDGTTLTARSFGCHKSVEGEVRNVATWILLPGPVLEGNFSSDRVEGHEIIHYIPST